MAKSATSALLVLAIFAAAVVAASGLADTRPVKEPRCEGKSKDSGYDAKVSILVTELVTKTPGKRSGHGGGEYRCEHSFPDSKAGSATGGGSCDKELGEPECWGCLVAAQNKLMKCHYPIAASVQLHDCMLWFKKI